MAARKNGERRTARASRTLTRAGIAGLRTKVPRAATTARRPAKTGARKAGGKKRGR